MSPSTADNLQRGRPAASNPPPSEASLAIMCWENEGGACLPAVDDSVGRAESSGPNTGIAGPSRTVPAKAAHGDASAGAPKWVGWLKAANRAIAFVADLIGEWT